MIKNKKPFIYSYVIGEGIPLFIFHGLFHDSEIMMHQLEQSQIDLDGFKRIYIDLPGMGNTRSSVCDANTDAIIDVLSPFIKELIEDQKFVVCGYSYGTYIAKGMAKKFRSQISAEIEICPVIETDVKKRTFPHIMHQTIDNSVFNKLNKRKKSYIKNN